MLARRTLGAALALASAAAVAGARVANPPPAPSLPESLAAGKLLVASRHLIGPYFTESVILLLDYGPDGALGLIVNRPLRVELAEILPDVDELQGRSDRAWFGGPVQIDRLMLLVRAEEAPPGAKPVVDDLHVSASPDTLSALLKGKGRAAGFHGYLGYAGWAPQQLDGEVARGDWLVVPSESGAVFSERPDAVWRDLIDRNSGIQVRRPREPATIFSRSGLAGRSPPGAS